MKKKEQFVARTIGGEHIMLAVGETALKFNGLIYAMMFQHLFGIILKRLKTLKKW